MSEKLNEVLSKLSASDVVIDPTGRIMIKDPNVAKQVQKLAAEADMVSGNGTDCNHGCTSPDLQSDSLQ